MKTRADRAIIKCNLFGNSRKEAPLDLKALVRNIPDFPKPGILFRDITPLIGNADAYE